MYVGLTDFCICGGAVVRRVGVAVSFTVRLLFIVDRKLLGTENL